MPKVKLSSKVRLPDSVKKAQLEYKKTRKNLLIKAYTKPLKARAIELKKNFKLKKAFGVLFTVLGLRIASDYKKMKRIGIKELKITGLNTQLRLIGHTLTAEMTKNPVLRNSIKAIAKDYPYLLLNKKGEIFVSSFDGNIVDPTSLGGKVFSKADVIPSKKILYENKKGLVRLNLNDLITQGNPKLESALVLTKKGTKRSGLVDATVAGYGHKEIILFYPSVGRRNSIERKILASEVKKKSIHATTDPEQKLVRLLLIDGEQIRIRMNKAKAEGLFRGLKLGS